MQIGSSAPSFFHSKLSFRGNSSECENIEFVFANSVDKEKICELAHSAHPVATPMPLK